MRALYLPEIYKLPQAIDKHWGFITKFADARTVERADICRIGEKSVRKFETTVETSSI